MKSLEHESTEFTGESTKAKQSTAIKIKNENRSALAENKNFQCGTSTSSS